ncbi:sulfite exporter TauE/SafE family protein [Pseudoduganella chitinolytica]|uniref:Probable membrane transporter protein n=1 Tax=Pseudoduganella chitinolytica TaxID=34070 RepID=A0ABY8B7X0_9BURK|nr:sulfite exporter TauE/SafE family protein [Pseudoduganella chitinolytica]WEF30847.1 sulfite exporter TauE/SafE family protein [Pseudoduganella chitinolytica]
METHIIYIATVFLLAGMVKGATGMGLPTVAMGLLGLVMAPMEAAALLVVPSLLTNGWQVLSGRPLYPLWLRLRGMMTGICLGTLAGGTLLLQAQGGGRVLGLALVLYGLLGLGERTWAVPERWEPWLAPLAGAATGLMTAATGVFVLPAVPYLQALRLDKDELVQAMGLSFTVSTLALAVVLAAHDAWQPAAAGASFLAQLPALAGLLLGQRLRGRLQPQVFRRCLFITLLLVGVHLVLADA